jgi:putative membrane protein
MGGGGWMWLWGSVMMLVLFAATVLIVWLLARSAPGHSPGGGQDFGPTERARSILAERLARGEIEPDEYNDRLRHLS